MENLDVQQEGLEFGANKWGKVRVSFFHYSDRFSIVFP